MAEIHAKIVGEGECIVLLHGFCETHHIWDKIQSDLSGDYQVICPDLPGCGDSFWQMPEFQLDDVSEILHQWLTEIGIKKCTMIGHSLGGYIALSFAKKYGYFLDKVGLFHSSIYDDDNEKKSSRDKTIQFIENNGLEIFVNSFFQNLIFDTNLADPHISEQLRRLQVRANLTPVNVVKGYLSAMRDRPDSSEWISLFSSDILFIAGVEDMIIPIVKSREQAKLSEKIIYYEMESVAHMGMIENYEHSLDILRKFLLRK